MPKTYYDSELTAEQIEDALAAIDGVVNPGNNGKVLYIDNGQIKAASASRWGHGAVLEPLNVTANGDYTPPTGTDGFDSVHVAVPSATLTTKSITANGTYNASQDGADGYSSVTVNVSGGGSAVVQPLSVTENGTYNPPSGVDGYAPVTVNVSGGGSDLYPLWTDIYDNPMPTGVSVTTPNITAPVIQPSWVASASQNVQSFVNNECRISSRSSASGGSATVDITQAMAQMSLDQLIHDGSIFTGLVEYYGNLYNNALLTTYNMVLLGDFSQGGSATGNALTDAITNYSAVALQGIYSKNRTSGYNTTIIYPLDLNVERWTGMKDRNNSYSCNVTFTDASTVSLSGNKQVIIYGIP